MAQEKKGNQGIQSPLGSEDKLVLESAPNYKNFDFHINILHGNRERVSHVQLLDQPAEWYICCPPKLLLCLLIKNYPGKLNLGHAMC